MFNGCPKNTCIVKNWDLQPYLGTYANKQIFSFFHRIEAHNVSFPSHFTVLRDSCRKTLKILYARIQFCEQLNIGSMNKIVLSFLQNEFCNKSQRFYSILLIFFRSKSSIKILVDQFKTKTFNHPNRIYRDSIIRFALSF